MASTRQATGRIIWLAAGLGGLLVLGLTTGAEQPDRTKPDMDPLKEPLALIAKAKAAYAKVDDYTCTLTKRETLNGKLEPANVVTLEARTDPFSVYMRWRKPLSKRGQAVCYVAGENDGKMRVKPSGLLGLIGFVSIARDDARVKKTTNHSITETGIGPLIDTFSAGWEMERKLGKTKVVMSDARFAGKPCRCVETIHPTSAGGKLLHYRNLVYFDLQTHLPIGVKNYDWPETPGEPGELLEEFQYTDLKLNVDLPDEDFEH